MYMSLFMFTACPQLVSHMNLVMSHYHISFPCSLQCKTRCVFGYENARGGWEQFCMGDAVLPCQSLLLLFLSVCRRILDEPQLGCFWHWRSWDLDSRCSAQVPWHVIHTLLSNLHWGPEGFLPPCWTPGLEHSIVYGLLGEDGPSQLKSFTTALYIILLFIFFSQGGLLSIYQLPKGE